MHKENSITDLGTIKIHKNVIVSIASLAVTEIEGVKCIGGNLKSELLKFLGKKNIYGAIRVEFDKNEDVKLEIPIVIKYGFSIPEIANKAQENVRNVLEKMTSLSIKNININIQSIEK